MSFAERLQGKLDESGETITQLSSRCQVSARTIYRALSDEHVPHRENVIALAFAFGEDPNSWLQDAGRLPLSAEELERAKIRFALHEATDTSEIHGRVLQEVLKEVKQKISQDTPMLMCVCYASKPAAGPARMEIVEEVSELVSKGLWLAMFCPYPEVEDRRRIYRDLCVRNYEKVFSDVVYLYEEYRNASDDPTRIRLFYPVGTGFYCVPLATSFGVRPTLLTPWTNGRLSREGMFLGAIAETPYDPQSRWYDIRDEDLRGAWIEYFNAASKSWAGPDGWKEQIPEDSRHWRLWDSKANDDQE